MSEESGLIPVLALHHIRSHQDATAPWQQSVRCYQPPWLASRFHPSTSPCCFCTSFKEGNVHMPLCPSTVAKRRTPLPYHRNIISRQYKSVPSATRVLPGVNSKLIGAEFGLLVVVGVRYNNRRETCTVSAMFLYLPWDVRSVRVKFQFSAASPFRKRENHRADALGCLESPFL